MSMLEWAAYAVCCLLALGLAAKVPRIWRGDVDESAKVPPTWPWGGISWRAVIRAGPASLIGGLTLIVAVPVLLSTPEEAHGAFSRPLTVVVPIMVVFYVGLMATISVMLFNRPRFLVAPHLRAAPGALAERAARRTRRARRRRP